MKTPGKGYQLICAVVVFTGQIKWGSLFVRHDTIKDSLFFGVVFFSVSIEIVPI